MAGPHHAGTFDGQHSECLLQTNEQCLFVGPVAAGSATVERGLLVYERSFQTCDRPPVDARSPGIRSADGGDGIGERRRTGSKSIVIDGQAGDSRHQLHCTDRFRIAKTSLVSGQKPLSGNLPGFVIECLAAIQSAGYPAHILTDPCPFTEESQ